MAIENTYLLGKNITLGCGFDLQAKAPLDSRQTVPAFEGLRALIIGDAAYEGMIVYDEGTKKTYQAQKCESYSVEVDGKTKTYDIAFREFGINESELKALIASETTAAMEFKGATATLPENPAKGDMWKATAAFEVAGETTKVGDSIVYNGEEWFRIPSGDDIEDTWRIIKVDGTSLGGIADGKELNLTAGDKLDVAIDAETGAVVYSHEAIDAPELLAENEQTRTYITAVETDGFGHITGYKTATENVVDTNTTYTFEGLAVEEGEDAPSNVYFQVTSSEEGASAEVIYVDAYNRNEADGKFVAKVDGKQLSTEDFTTALLNKLNGIADEANKYEHATHTAYAEGFYKVTVDAEGHVSNATAVTKEDIVALGIPGQDTTYEKATADADGLMSKEHFSKVEGISEGATKVENVGGGKIKIDGTEVTVYAHPDKHVIDDVTGLQDALNGKVASVAAGDNSITVGGEDTAPTIAVKISAAEGNAIELADDGLKVIIPESTKVEASETNGNIKVDGAEVTVYTHPDKHAIGDVTGLQDALDAINDADDGILAQAKGYVDGLIGVEDGLATYERAEEAYELANEAIAEVILVKPDEGSGANKEARFVFTDSLGNNTELAINSGNYFDYVIDDNAEVATLTATEALETAVANANSALQPGAIGTTVAAFEHEHVVADITDYETDVASRIENYAKNALNGLTIQSREGSSGAELSFSRIDGEDTTAFFTGEDGVIVSQDQGTVYVGLDQDMRDTIDAKLDADTFNTYIDGKAMSDEDLKGYADGKVDALADAVYTKSEVEALFTWGSF